MFEIAPAVGISSKYKINKSLRFNSADSAYLTRTFTTGNRKTWTWSAWVKRSAISTAQKLFVSSQAASNTDAVYLEVSFGAGGKLQLSGSSTFWRETSAVYRDVSAWYHIVAVCDTTNATANSRFKLFVNGQEVTSFSTLNNPTQNSDLGINVAQQHSIGARSQISPIAVMDGYMSEVNFIDGQALTANSFGKTDSTTGQWIPKKYTGSYGTNGFYLPFNDGTSTTTLGYDRSGNSNNWTLTNFSVAAGVNNDWMEDTPTNNFSTMNILDSASTTLVNGALGVSTTGASAKIRSAFGMSSGTWYWEVEGCNNLFGICTQAETVSSVLGISSSGFGYIANGNKFTNNTQTAYGASYTTTDIIGVAFDADTGSLTFYKNGVSQGVAFTGLTAGPYFIAVTTTALTYFNFGQRPFTYTPPAGFKSLCTKNLPTPIITNPNKYFNAKTYNGTGAVGSVTGMLFQPDFVWIKPRNVSAAHYLIDSVRGKGTGDSYRAIETGAATAEFTAENTQVTSLNSDGFSLGNNSDNTFYVNRSGDTYVAWNWKESPTSGFDIVTYTGNGALQTISHNLGVVPAMIIIKNRSTSTNWPVWHMGFANATDYIWINSTTGKQTSSAYWNNTLPTSTEFTVNTHTEVNGNTNDIVAYVFAEVAGYSKFGKYTGNGSTDGPFVFCGFKPKYVMVKRIDSSNDWICWDTARDSYNLSQTGLFPNSPAAESVASTESIDMLSNGFKVRGTSSRVNASGGTYIFMAFAEAPLKYSTAR